MRIILADDHPTVLLGIQALLGQVARMEVVGTATTADQLLSLIATTACDVLVTDYTMPGGRAGDGLGMLLHLRRQYPALTIILHSMQDVPTTLAKVRRLGVRHIVSKADGAGHLGAALQAAEVGGDYLSPTVATRLEALADAGRGMPGRLTAREHEVVRLFISGMTVNAIATQLHRSKQTISSQKTSAMRKLGVQHDAELVQAWLALDPESHLR